MFKVALIDSQFSKKGGFSEIQKLCEARGGELKVLQCTSDEEIVAQAADAEALLVVYSKVGHELLAQLPKCRVAVRLGIGVDNYDLEAFTRHGVVAVNVPDYGVEEVAAHALGLILAAERKIVYFDRQVRRGVWDDGEGYTMRRLSQRTLGFLGFGRIARKLAECCAPLGYRMIAFDPMLPREIFESLNVQPVSQDNLFRQCDTLALMAPLTAQTRHIVNDESLALAKDGLRIINTARGELIDTEALIRALDSGKVVAAGLDVLEGEPLQDSEHPLLQFDQVFVTPHTAYQTLESIAALRQMAMTTAMDFLEGKPPYNVVNPAVLENLDRTTLA
jgi:D-3-phosphoglycerate dehydrogenase